MKKRFLAMLAAVLLPSCLFAQFGVVSPLHVNGNQLNDAYGNKVVCMVWWILRVLTSTNGVGVILVPITTFNHASAITTRFSGHSKILPKALIVTSSVFISSQVGPMIPTSRQRGVKRRGQYIAFQCFSLAEVSWCPLSSYCTEGHQSWIVRCNSSSRRMS